MKKLLTLLVAAGLSLTAMTASAQSSGTLKVAVVDMAKLLDSHHKTEEQNAKLQADEKKAQEEIEKLNKEGNALLAELRELQSQGENPTLSNERKSELQQKVQAKGEEVQRKKVEVESFRQNTQRSFQQRIKTFRDLMLEEIGKTASEIAKKKGATLLLDKSGPSLIGISSVVYFDPSYDITDEVMREINKGRPAGSGASTGGATTGDQPRVSFPGGDR